MISVVIPTFNRCSTIKSAVESVLNQTYTDLELIIVDDGSTDSTREVLLEISDPRMKVFFQENRGVSHARNQGLARCSRQWITFLDSDDQWMPKKLEKQLQILESRPDLKVIHGEEQWVRNGKKVNQKKIHQKYGGFIFEKCLPLCLISPSAVMIHKEVFENIGNFNEEFIVCEDYELWLRITSAYEVGFVKEPIIYKYGGHEDQLSAKYKAMDYYRIKAMKLIYENRVLDKEVSKLLFNILIQKANILVNGYIKHNNTKDLDEVQEHLDWAIKEMESLS